jgi:hypothetical protein
MYAVIAPGFKGVYDNPRVLDKIMALYPYARFRKYRTEEECWEFLNKNTVTRGISAIYKYGNTFKKHFVNMEYFIRESIFFNYFTDKVGYVRMVADDAVVENCSGLIKVRLDNIVVDNNKISGHMVAIYQGLRLIGDWMDVNITVPDHSVFYALHAYTGNNRAITKVQNHMKERQGEVALTLPGRVRDEY